MIFRKEEEEKDENENIEAPPSVIQSQIGDQSQSKNDIQIPSINNEISEFNNNKNDNENNKERLRSNPNKQEKNNCNEQNHLSDINEILTTPSFLNMTGINQILT